MISGTGEDGVVDLGSLLAEGQDHPQGPAHVYLLEVANPADGSIHKSVHTSVGGAQQRLDQVVAVWSAAPESLEIAFNRLPLEP